MSRLDIPRDEWRPCILRASMYGEMTGERHEAQCCFSSAGENLTFEVDRALTFSFAAYGHPTIHVFSLDETIEFITWQIDETCGPGQNFNMGPTRN